MTKYSFLNELDQLLGELGANERREILEDYEEHFAFAKRADKSDAEVIELVGTPAEIASEILGSKVEKTPADAVGGDNEAQQEALQEQKEALEAQAEALEAQAEALEAKLAAQAEALEAQAEALEAQAEALGAEQEALEDEEDIFEAEDETFVEDFLTQAGSFVETLVDQAGVFVGNMSETISDAMSEATLENAVESGTLIEEIVDVAGVKNVIIKARNQKVDIEKTTSSTARVRLTKGMLATRVEGDTLYVEAREMKRKMGIGLFINIETLPELKVELPESVYELIQAKTSNAKIEIESFELDKLDLESTNGKLEVSGVKANILKLETNNGKIEVNDSKGNVTAKTTNGKIDLVGIAGAVYAHSTNAKIALDGVTGDIKAKTTNGKVELRNDTINQNVKLSSVNAKIGIMLQEKPESAKFELTTSNAKTKLFGTDRNYDVFGEGAYEVKLTTSNARIDVGLETDF